MPGALEDATQARYNSTTPRFRFEKGAVAGPEGKEHRDKSVPSHHQITPRVPKESWERYALGEQESLECKKAGGGGRNEGRKGSKATEGGAMDQKAFEIYSCH